MRLQWGHDTGVVEEARLDVPCLRPEVLQWGHDTGVVEEIRSI